MECFPFYLSLGCSYEEFWNGEPWIVESYRKAQEYRLKEENHMLWMQGIYFYDALASIMTNAFSNKTKKYMDKPIDMFPNTSKNEVDTRNDVINSLNRWKMHWDLSKKNKGSD